MFAVEGAHPSQISACLASLSAAADPPHPFDNDIATSYRTSAIFSHRQFDTLPITQNGQDLVSAHQYLAEVDHGRQSKLLRAERTAVNRAGRRTTWNRRRTEKNFTTQGRQTPEPELDAAGRPQTAWIDDRKRWKAIGQLELGHSSKSFTDGGLLAAVVPPVASSR
ncbi:hypothetical protein FJTKL_11980 [Diaporthe vaccinii]|uniref:Uncharacterized protein n=1 Tax=Diaporthe vaccinii TaxID=105482 RepID=A0ABR4FBC6_9PEZI